MLPELVTVALLPAWMPPDVVPLMVLVRITAPSKLLMAKIAVPVMVPEFTTVTSAKVLMP